MPPAAVKKKGSTEGAWSEQSETEPGKKKKQKQGVLLIGMYRSHSLPCTPKLILNEASENSHLPNMHCFRDKIRICHIEAAGDYQCWTIGRSDPQSSCFHHSVEFGGYRRNPMPMPLGLKEVSVDFVFMPSEYLIGILAKQFFQYFLARDVSKNLAVDGQIFIPINATVLCHILNFWVSEEEEWCSELRRIYFARLIRPDQENESLLVKSTIQEEMEQLQKPSDQLVTLGVTLADLQNLRSKDPKSYFFGDIEGLFESTFPLTNSHVRFLCLKKRKSTSAAGISDRKDNCSRESVALLSSFQKKISKGTFTPIKCERCGVELSGICCSVCQSQPIRAASLSTKLRYLKNRTTDVDEDGYHEFDEDNEEGEFDSSSAYNLKDELAVARGKDPAAFKKKQSVHSENRKLNIEEERRMRLLDKPNGPGSWWGTVVMHPKALGRSSQFSLTDSMFLKSNFRDKIIFVEKALIQTTLHFRLDVCPHSVNGSEATTSLASKFGAKVIKLCNNKDHFYSTKKLDEEHHVPLPCVINTRAISGFEQSSSSIKFDGMYFIVILLFSFFLL